MRDIIRLACTDCKRRNYSTTKNKKKTTERLELSKSCRFCRKHTSHRESNKWQLEVLRLEVRKCRWQIQSTFINFALRT